MPFLEYRLGQKTDVESFARLQIHRSMLQDRKRCQAFHRAISAQVKPGMRVLDVGSGTGILGIWALGAGAAHLYSVEASRLAERLDATFRANGISADKFTVIAGRAELVGEISAELCVLEILGHIGIDEGILSVAHAIKTRAGIEHFIPKDVELTVAAVAAPTFEKDVVSYWLGRELGIDFSNLAELTRRSSYLTRLGDLSFLSRSATLCRFGVGAEPPRRLRYSVPVKLTRDGTVDGVTLSFRSDLGGGVGVDGGASDNWMPVFLPLEAPLTASAGSEMVVTVDLDGEPSWSVSGL